MTKVNLSIVQSGKTRVGRISKGTQLHRQDIYKLLPKLEKMGLITRTIDKPFMIEAIHIEKALDSLVSKERKKANERISHLENNLKDVVNSLQDIGTAVRSVRLDKYFSTRSVIKLFGRIVSMFLIPRKNIAKVGAWADILTRTMASPVGFLSDYFHRNVCESGFSSDKGSLAESSSREGRIVRKLRSSQTRFCTTSTRLESTQNSFVPRPEVPTGDIVQNLKRKKTKAYQQTLKK